MTEISALRTAPTWADPAVGYLASTEVYLRLEGRGWLNGVFPHPVKADHRLPPETFVAVGQKDWDAA